MTASGADDREALAELLASWTRDDSPMIPRLVRNSLADVILASGWLARVKREAAAAAEGLLLRETADRLDAFVFPAGSDALEPMFRLVASLRARADRIEGATDADH